MAFDMMEGIEVMVDPGTGGKIEMRIGCHSGSVVSGVVGLKMPRLVKSSNLPYFDISQNLFIYLDHNIDFLRYCLFGLNVALTEKFESNSQPMKIHISQPCKDLLSPQYKCVERTDEGLADKVGFLLILTT